MLRIELAYDDVPAPAPVPADPSFLQRRAAGLLELLAPPPDRIPYNGTYELRARWRHDHYTRLRNAAWAARNARAGANQNPLALHLVNYEALRLVAAGELPLFLFEAYAELLMKP